MKELESEVIQPSVINTGLQTSEYLSKNFSNKYFKGDDLGCLVVNSNESLSYFPTAISDSVKLNAHNNGNLINFSITPTFISSSKKLCVVGDFSGHNKSSLFSVNEPLKIASQVNSFASLTSLIAPKSAELSLSKAYIPTTIYNPPAPDSKNSRCR